MATFGAQQSAIGISFSEGLLGSNRGWSSNIVNQVLTDPTEQVQDFSVLFEDYQVFGDLGAANAEYNPVVAAPAVHQYDVDRPNAGFGNPGSGNSTPGVDWFEAVHIKPTLTELGNLLSDTNFTIDVYNAFRTTSETLNSITNNLGSGASIAGASTPANLPPQRGDQYVVTILTDGPAEFDATFDFDFNSSDQSSRVSGTRIVLFPYVPQSRPKETLEWLSTIFVASNGDEQRQAIRRFPRQIFEYAISINTDLGRSELDLLLAGWQPRIFGVPLWWWARSLTANASSGGTTIQCEDLTYVDIEVGDLVLIAEFDPTTDTVTTQAASVSAIGSPRTSGSVTIASTLDSDFTAEYSVIIPVRSCLLRTQLPVQRAPSGDSEYQCRFEVIENDRTTIADSSAFSTFVGKLLLEDCIGMNAIRQDSIIHEGRRIDNRTGDPSQIVTREAGAQVIPYRWYNETPQQEWERRALLYSIQGRLTSFFVATNLADFNLVATISSGSGTIDVTNIGLARFGGLAPLDHLRIKLTNGTTYDFTITNISEISDTVERISIAPNSPATITVAEIDRIMYLRHQRLSKDSVTILHNWTDSIGLDLDSEIDFTTVSVPENA